MKTKSPPSLLPGYLLALRKHLKLPPSTGLQAARRQGLRAIAAGLETLDLARIHEEALITLVLTDSSRRSNDGLLRRASAFFAEALTPIEETHRGAREANAQLKLTVETLTLRTVELASTNDELKCEILQRKSVEDSLRISEQTSSELLIKSRNFQEELRHLSRQLLSAQEEERKRISRELHDVVAQTLTSINIRLSSLQFANTANIKEMRKKIAATQRMVIKSVGIVHRFARDLRPAVLDDLGLIPALQAYLKDFMARTGIRTELITFADVEKLSSALKTVLYRVVQEALTNIARHSGASRAKVSISKPKAAVHMEIHDNGKGFNVEDPVFSKRKKRLGLLGMRERVEMVGGAFCVESEPGQMTNLMITIPDKKQVVRPVPQKRRKNPLLRP